jgi:hypothetical protein
LPYKIIKGEIMEYTTRQNPLFSACGLNCGLCPRHYTAGASRCPGCAGDGFNAVHPACGVLTCAQKRGLESCCLCEDFPCKKLDGVDQKDSFITHKNQLRDLDKARGIGLEAYAAELDLKVKLLEQLLGGYDDGRRKSFFCTAANLLELRELELAAKQISSEAAACETIKEKAAIAARVLEETAERQGISLKLRK